MAGLVTDPRLTRTSTHFICQICIEWVENNEAYEDRNGDRWDICVRCGLHEERRHEERRHVPGCLGNHYGNCEVSGLCT